MQQEAGRKRGNAEVKGGKKKVKTETEKPKKEPKSKKAKEGMKEESPLHPSSPPQLLEPE
jgi:hypothetical protein